ncbi:MAG: response regulator [Anaerolineae bacterium]|nr:response regulator [Anaerolineae bacterium]
MEAGTPQAHILVIDDSETEAGLLRDALTGQGYAVRTANRGKQGLAMALTEPPDLIIQDVVMPDMLGYEVCEQLKADERTQDIPVIFVSALDDLADKEKAFSVGGIDYITKPFQVQEVWTRTRTHLGLRNLQKRLEEQNAQLEREVRYREHGRKMSEGLAERLRIQHEIDQSILAARSPETIAIAAVGRTRRLIPCQRVMIIERTQAGETKLLAAESDSQIGLEMDIAVRQQAFDEPALRGGHMFGCANLETLKSRSPMQQALYQEGIRSYVIAPLVVDEELVGTLNLEACSPQVFEAEHMTIAHEIAALLRIAIRQVRLYELAQQEIAERQLAEEALRQYTVELEARNTELDAFTHTVAHDLKTPLTALIGFGKLLEKRYAKLESEQIRNSLHIITQNGIMMTNIIDELLLLASVRKIDEIETSALDMIDIVDQVRMRLSAMIDEYNAEIIVPDKWPAAVGYAAWIREVWANYLSNAIKYGGTPPWIEFGAGEQPTEANDTQPMVRFWVRDNGPGIPTEDQKKLFTLFTRLDQTRARGHGLGLSIVKRIIEKLGGEVGVESEMGQGSTFWFSLPGPQLETRDGTPL